MRTTQLNVFFFIAAITTHCTSNAATDTLPPCINTLRIQHGLDITEYDYKGQHWFVKAKPNAKIENYPDKLTTIQFYNEECKPVCIWQKGGIAGLNKVTPDTIDKNKIVMILSTKFDTLQKKDTNLTNLPDTIIKIALQNKTTSIQQYSYKGQTLYKLYAPLSSGMQQMLLAKGITTIDEPYYDQKGTIIIRYKRALQGMFQRAAQWVPSSVQQTDVVKIKNGAWYRKEEKFEKEAPLNPVTNK